MSGNGYRKSEETRQRILAAALEAFGSSSFSEATTRQIADAARVSLPVLQYHFGSKEGLYRACAEAIVERYREHMAPIATRAREALRSNGTAAAARKHLKVIAGALAGFLIGSNEVKHWAHFVGRELREPGPAFDILYESLWKPGVEVTARLIARARGIPEKDPAARIHALLLISSLLAFQSGRKISLRVMQWSKIGPKELAMIRSALDAQIDAIGGGA